MKHGVFGILSIVFLAACAPQRQAARPDGNAAAPLRITAEAPQTPQQEALLEQSLLQNARDQKHKLNYKIQPGDLIEITVYKEADMNRTARISGNGTITFPLAGVLKLSELAVPEAESLLAERLSEFLVKPQVTVLIKEYGNKQVYVLGEVKKPGSIQIPAERRLTILEAITMAGGFTELAAQDRTKVLRGAGDKTADIYLEPNDTVYVPQSFF